MDKQTIEEVVYIAERLGWSATYNENEDEFTL